MFPPTVSHAFGFGGLLALLLAVIVALAISSGGDDPTVSAGAGATASGAEAGHVHGLGVNPADGSLMIATHTGLFAAGQGSTQAPRVGTSDRDVMGFGVVGPDHFVGSGHPGSEPGLPGNLGLIESRDGGRSWRPVSLLGEADFHVLRASGRQIYGFDGAGGRFLVSNTLGRDWQQRDGAPAAFDLAIDPSNPARVLAATEDGLQESRDEGRAWRKVSDSVALLAWAAPERLFLLDQDGRVLRSSDDGASFSVRAEL